MALSIGFFHILHMQYIKKQNLVVKNSRVVILDQYNWQIPHYKGNRVTFGSILGQKMEKNGYF